MELPSKRLEELAFNTRPKIGEHMLIVMEKSTHVKKSSQPLQTNNEQFQNDVNLFTGNNGIFNVTNINNTLNFAKSIQDDDLSQIVIPSGAFALERRIFIRKLFYRRNLSI